MRVHAPCCHEKACQRRRFIAATSPYVRSDEIPSRAHAVGFWFITPDRVCRRHLASATASVRGRSDEEVGHTMALRAAVLRRAFSRWWWAQSAHASIAWGTLALVEEAFPKDMNTPTWVAQTRGVVPRALQRPNTSLNRTRNGMPRLGLISFWPKRGLPLRAG